MPPCEGLFVPLPVPEAWIAQAPAQAGAAGHQRGHDGWATADERRG